MSDIEDGLKLLAIPDVRKMFIAYLITYMGTAMAPIAMAFGVLDLTGSTKDAAIVIAAPTIASIFVLLLGGALADRCCVLRHFCSSCVFLKSTITKSARKGITH